MGITVQSVTCPSRPCGGVIGLIPEELYFVRLDGWDPHVNLICPFCVAPLQMRSREVVEREVTASFIAVNYRKRFPDVDGA
jgi:hypothetical protein